MRASALVTSDALRDSRPLAVTRKVDGHGLAVWQVVHIGSEASTTVERPNPAELIRSALTGLGYRPAEAQHAIEDAARRLDEEPRRGNSGATAAAAP